MKTIFVSDIHMGDENSLKRNYPCPNTGQYKYGWLGEASANKFAKFLQHGVLYKEEVNELVILGDLFDVWLCPANCDPPGGTGDILKQFNAIAAAPQNKGIIENLKLIAEKNKLTYVNGNHDMQLTEEIIRSIIPGIKCAKDEIYKIPDQGIWAEHGHHYAFFAARDDQGSHILPIGYFITRLMAQFYADTGKNEDMPSIAVYIILEVLKEWNSKLKSKFDDFIECCKKWNDAPCNEIVGELLKAVYAGFQDYVYGIPYTDVTTTMRFNDGFEKYVKASEVNRLYNDLSARWINRPNHSNMFLAFLTEITGEALKVQAMILSSEKDRRLIIFGHTHFPELSHYYSDKFRLDNDPHLAKYRDKYHEVMEKLSQAVAEITAGVIKSVTFHTLSAFFQ